jgi:hypothetical protein
MATTGAENGGVPKPVLRVVSGSRRHATATPEPTANAVRGAVRQIASVAVLVLLPAVAFAQGTLTGTVRDASGAILPGVTVEASSPALIERVRTVVTDGTGQYRLIELNPGTYSLTFTLPGFVTVRREGLVLAGSATLTIPIELPLGDLQETITVSGETPVVDVQTVRRETVLDSEIIAAIPATRAYGSLLNLTPGLTVDNNGLAATPTMTFFSARGGQTNEGRVTINGMTVAAAFNGGGVSSLTYDSVNAEEVSVVVSGGLGESDIGGPVMNIVPRAGGNSFRGSAFINNAGDWSRGNNLDDRLRAVGITERPGIISSYDGSLSYGGPIRRDRLWFFGSYRKLDTTTAVEGIVANANAGDLSRWDWVADDSITARQMQGRQMFIGRLTAQASARHRLSFNHEYQTRCEGSPLRLETSGCHNRGSNWVAAGSATTSPEAHTAYFDFPYYVTQALWTAPMTHRLLLEAGFSRFSYYHAGGPGQLPPDGIFDIGVTQQSAAINPATGLPYAPRANYTYRALSQYLDNYGNPNNWRASASYVTGSHNLKVGYQGTYLIADTHTVVNPTGLSYTFNQANPTAFTFRIPGWRTADRTQTASVFIQDAWTRGRLTLQGALRYDRAWSFSPAEGNGTTETSRFNAEPITFERTIGVNAYNDITPRIGVAYDVFGNGRTAVKFNLGHYLDAATNDSIYTANNPAGGARIVRTVNRSWQDTNGNRIVDCDVMNFAAHTAGGDTCGALGGNNLNFGSTSSTVAQVNPDLLKGWGVRENDWQWGLNVQQEVISRVAVEVGYNRRWWYGFRVTDNLVRDPSQYDEWTILAPLDPRLPGGGGYPITLHNVTPAANAIPAQNYVTFETDFGKRTEYWHGIDVTGNARLRNGLALQAGTSTGRKVVNTCSFAGTIDSPNMRNCRDVDPFQTTLRGLATYTVPKVDVLVSATMRSQPPLQRAANWNVPNTEVQQLLGRLPTGGLATGNTTVALLDSEHRVYADNRRTQIDMRLAKLLRFARTRADIGIDVGNLLNTNYATGYENTYQYSEGNTLQGGSWNNPTAVYTPRFVRLNFGYTF